MSLRLVQELRGNQQFWLEVMPCLAPYLGATNDLLGPPDQEGMAVARGADPDGTWVRFWEAIELQRFLVDEQLSWEERFTHPLVGSLTLPEFLTFPGLRDQVVWASGDATTTAIGAIDWEAKEAVVESASALWTPLQLFLDGSRAQSESTPEGDEARFAPVPHGVEEEEEEVMIALAELLAVIGLVSVRWKSWSGKVVIYAGDNQNVVSWLKSRSAKPPAARYLLQVLGAAEAVGRFRLHAEYIRTYHNKAADDLTRLDPHGVLEEHGLFQVRAIEPLREILDRGWVRKALVWGNMEDSDRSAALQLGLRRALERPTLRGPEVPLRSRVLELVAGLPVYTRELARRGAQAAHVQLGDPMWSGPTAPTKAEGKWDLVCGSLGREAKKEYARNILEVALSVEPRALVFDALSSQGPLELQRSLPSEWKGRVDLLSGRTAQDHVWWRRWVFVACHGTEGPEQVLDSADSEPNTKPKDSYGTEWVCKLVPDEFWLKKGLLRLDSAMPYLKSATPKPVGSVEVPVQGRSVRRLVWEPSRPLPQLHSKSWNPQSNDSLLLLGSNGGGPAARTLTASEAVGLLGGRLELLPNEPPEELARYLHLATPRTLAGAVGNWLEKLETTFCPEDCFSPGVEPEKAGVCRLEWEEKALNALVGWLHERGYPSNSDSRVGGLDSMEKKHGAKGKGKGWKGKPPMVQLEHALTRQLRHEGFEGAPMSEQGWVKLNDVIQFFRERHPVGRLMEVTAEAIRAAVHNDSKQRMVIRPGEDGELAVAAWSGHTLEGVAGPSVPVDITQVPEILYHGTYRRLVPSIQSKGILAQRRMIHLQDCAETTGRWRADLEVQIEVKTAAAAAAGCGFRKTGNLVWLCAETIPPTALGAVEPWSLSQTADLSREGQTGKASRGAHRARPRGKEPTRADSAKGRNPRGSHI